MVTQVERDDTTWHTCETCGLMFDNEIEAEQHEERCESSDADYIQ